MGFMSQTTDRATEAAKDTASHARANLVDLGTQLLRLLNDMRDTRARAVDGLLGHIGLQRRESALRPVIWIAVGAVAAGAIVLAVAPSSGKELRRRLADWLAREGEQLSRRGNHEPAKTATNATSSAP